MQLDLEGGVLAGQLLSLVLLGELDVDVELLAGLVADDLLLEAGDEGAGAQHQRVVLSLAALESNTVNEALKVDVNGVAVLGSTSRVSRRPLRSCMRLISRQHQPRQQS